MGLETYQPGMSSPAGSLFAITPGTGDLTNVTRGLYVGGAGDVVVVARDGQEVTFKSVPAGTTIPIQAQKVLAVGVVTTPDTTTATDLIGMY